MNARRTSGSLLWTAAWLAIVAAATGGMFWIRGVVLARQQTPTAAEQWTEWREDVQEHEGVMDSVQRRVPASVEPPAIVLMRDHFIACLIAVVVGSALVSGITIWLLRGALRSG